MKTILPEIEQQHQDTKQEVVAKQQKEYKLIGKQRVVKGHILFEFNKITKEIKPAQISRSAALSLQGQPVFTTKAEVHQDCFYLQALNVRNARKKLIKLGFEL